MSRDIDEWLDDAQPGYRIVPICLRGDLAAQHDQLQDQLETLPETNSLAGNPERKRITDEMAALAEQVRAATRPFRLQAMSVKAYQELEAKHPPRRDGDQVDRRDAFVGFNRESMPEPLIRACLVDPVLDDDRWAKLVGKLTDAQLDKLFLAAFALNKRDVDIPFSPAASTTPTSEPK